MVFDINIPPLDKISNSSYGPMALRDIHKIIRFFHSSYSKPSFFSFVMKSLRLHGVHLTMDDHFFESRHFIVQINPTYHRQFIAMSYFYN